MSRVWGIDCLSALVPTLRPRRCLHVLEEQLRKPILHPSPRATLTEATEELKKELTGLGADAVVTETQFLSREWKDQLAEITNKGREQIGLGLNCVGGKSATALARSLGEGATMVSYGGMARQPVALPVGLLIFKDIRFVGFWLSRWNQQDPTGRRHMTDYIVDSIREGKFQDVPLDEVAWNWETEASTLTEEVQKGLQGFRKGKGIFVFGDT